MSAKSEHASIDPPSEGALEWLTILLASTTAALVVVAYLILEPQSHQSQWIKLIVALLPNVVVALVIYIVIALALRRKGITMNTWSGDRTVTLNPASVDAIASRVQAICDNKTESPGTPHLDFELVTNFRQVPWETLIEAAKSSITSVVYYCDTWISQYYEPLKAFASRPNTRFELILANTVDREVLAQVLLAFPSYTESQIASKVHLTEQGARNVFSDVGASESRVSVSLCTKPLNYSMFIFDEKLLVVWLVDMNRRNTNNSPALIINLSSSEPVRAYFIAELAGVRGNQSTVRSG